MRAAVFFGARDVRVEQVPDPRIEQPTDAIVRITHAAICGSDLWPYRGINAWQPGWRLGHEWIGVVEEVGAEVRTVRRGDRVLAPFSFSDGSCEFCQKGLQTACLQVGYWGATNDGGQAEAIRAPLADGTLVPIPPEVANDTEMLTKMVPLTDVLATAITPRSPPGCAPAAWPRWSATARWACAGYSPLAASVRSGSSPSAIIPAGWSWRDASGPPTW